MRRWWADAGLLYAAAVWGSTFFLVKEAVAEIPPVTMVGWRFGLGALVLLPWLLYKKADLRRDLREGAVLGFVLLTLYVAQTEGLRWTSASNSGFITGLFVLFVPLFLFFFLRRRPTPGQWAAVALALAGLWVLTGGVHGVNYGDALTLIAAAAYAAHLLLIDRYVRRGCDPLLLALHQFWFIGAVSLGWAWLAGVPLGTGGARATGILAFLVLVPTCSAFFIQLYAQRVVPPMRVSLIFSMEPVFAALFAWTLGGESFEPRRGFGGLFIVAAMILGEIARPAEPVEG